MNGPTGNELNVDLMLKEYDRLLNLVFAMSQGALDPRRMKVDLATRKWDVLPEEPAAMPAAV